MTAIGTARLRRSGVEVSRLSLGTAGLGNLFRPVPDDDAAAVVREALAAGLRYVDTAPHYGLGLAERRLGTVLPGTDRASFTLSTKVGRLLRPLRPGEAVEGEGYVDTPALRREWDLSAEGVRRSVEESLERLGLDRIDVLYLHDPDDHETEAVASAIPALLALRDEGLVGAVGAGMNQSEMLARFVERFDIDVVLLAGRYTLLDQSGLAELLPLCTRRGVDVVVGGAFNSGLLADPRPGATFDYQRAPAELVARAQELQALCLRHDVPLTAAALQFPLAHPAVVSVLNGPQTVEQLRANVASFTTPVPEALWKEIRSRELVPAGVPLPGDG
jgi:D-threo-aldose 1-dehydrogenase